MSKYDKMVACNRKMSMEKIELAKKEIFEMMTEGEKVKVPKLMKKTGLSRGFFYKNPTVRKLLDQALEQQIGMPDPRREILNMAMDNEITMLRERIRTLERENKRLKEEIEKLHKAVDRKNMNLFKNL